VTQYVNETLNSVHLVDFAVGISKSVVFGVLVDRR
jgi:ABC-type transporter Mla maintaining outer membrane lipid asymmetry permease subunit MlaE